MELLAVEIGMGILGAIFTVLWWLLRQQVSSRDKQIQDMQDAHEKEIAKLWEKHDEDARRLQDLELDIAKKHYLKEELDGRFERFEIAIRDDIKELGKKFDSLFDILIKNGSRP